MCITVLVLTINSVFLSLKRWQLISKQKDLGFWPQKLGKKKLVIVWIQEKDSLRSVFYGSLTLSFIKNFKCWLGHFLSLISPMHFAQSQAGAWYTINILRTNNQLQLCVGTHTGLPGSSPGGSRVIRRWGQSWRPGKNLFNYRYRGRLETDSVVGELEEKRR